MKDTLSAAYYEATEAKHGGVGFKLYVTIGGSSFLCTIKSREDEYAVLEVAGQSEPLYVSRKHISSVQIVWDKP